MTHQNIKGPGTKVFFLTRANVRNVFCFRSGSNSAAAAAAKMAARKAAKRSGRDRAYSTSEDGKFGGGLGDAAGTAALQGTSAKNSFGKNSRKSRNGYGRGLPKKG